jgi:predicted CoA-substrate-specific enzyme activase
MKDTKGVFCGLDMGSRMAKGVLVRNGQVLARAVGEQRPRGGLGEKLVDELLGLAHLRPGEVVLTLATGYSRATAPADGVATEVTCQTLGVRQHVPQARTIVDIGGQDSKVIYVAEQGAVEDFVLNDQCAAGTGRFLEKMAELLGTDVVGLGRLATASTTSHPLTTPCAVFAETELVALLSSGAAPAALAAGVLAAVASRIRLMTSKNPVSPVVLTGGVALIPGMAQRLAEVLEIPVEVAPNAYFTCALGAAVLARHRWETSPAPEEPT